MVRMLTLEEVMAERRTLRARARDAAGYTWRAAAVVIVVVSFTGLAVQVVQHLQGL